MHQQQQHYTRPYVAPNMNLANENPHHNNAHNSMTNNNNLSNSKLSSYAKNRSQNNTLKGQISTLSHSNHKPSNLSTNLITPTSSENNSELTFTDNELAMARDNTLLHKGRWVDDSIVDQRSGTERFTIGTGVKCTVSQSVGAGLDKTLYLGSPLGANKVDDRSLVRGKE